MTDEATEAARKASFRSYSDWDGQYHTSGYAGAHDHGFAAGVAEGYRQALSVLHAAVEEPDI